MEAAPHLVIAGAGHISRVLAGMMVRMGFSVHVIDDRADYANPDRFPPPFDPVAGDIAKTLSDWPVNHNTYVVIVTRGHKHDEQALRSVLSSNARYIGMIGSRRKIKVIFDDLQHAGATEAQLSRLHAPIGLDISAVTANEIALSIAAQLVSVRRADHRDAVQGPIRISQSQGMTSVDRTWGFHPITGARPPISFRCSTKNRSTSGQRSIYSMRG